MKGGGSGFGSGRFVLHMSSQIVQRLKTKYPALRTHGFHKSVGGYIEQLEIFGNWEKADLRSCVRMLKIERKRIPDAWFWATPDIIPVDGEWGVSRGVYWEERPILVAVEIEVTNPLSCQKLWDYDALNAHVFEYLSIGFVVLRVDRYGAECVGDPEWFLAAHPRYEDFLRGTL